MTRYETGASPWRLGATAAAAVAAMAALWYLAPPRPLRDRMRGRQPDEPETTMDLQLYEDDADDGFWNDADDAPLRLVNAARVPYFQRIWARHTGPSHGPCSSIQDSQAVQSAQRRQDAPARYLDVGCGGGVATEELAKLGFTITGLDPAAAAITSARRRAERLGITNVDYREGSAFDLPWPPNSFDGVVSSDVLEHLDDVHAALGEIFRVLKPGGVFVFDTINRTMYAWVTTILVAQRFLRYVPPDAHDWRLYITPAELKTGLLKAGFELGPDVDWVGMGPTLYLPHQVLYRALVLQKGRASFFGPWGQSRYNTAASYLGWARKPEVKEAVAPAGAE
ncbi:unnamed protein product [Parajaminaea phylloscopi]